MSSIENKLLNCEVPPPAGVWDKIAAALDESVEEKQAYADRLYNLEIAPPQNGWSKIESVLVEETTEKKPVRRIPFLRYAAAAAIIGAIAVGVFKWAPAGKNQGVAGNSETVLPTTPTNPSVTATDPGTNTPANKEDDSIKEQPADYARLDRLAKTNMKRALSQYRSSSAGVSHAVYAYEDYVPDLADRYVMLMTPEGSIIRMSKKLGDLICCVSGEEQGNDCKDQLKKWQEKMAMSPLAPSPGNFMDILSLVNSLDDAEL